ncbi:MAG TPA: serine protease, partial [Egibacteraceae bacterium]|nr:serine protease [Egibacteraceae bacterium]
GHGGPRHPGGPDDGPVQRGLLEEPVIVRQLPARAGDARGFFRKSRDVVMGTERRIGLWVLPLFLVMGLLGATLAGGLAMLYYGQQVRDLERSTTRVVSQLEERGAELERIAEEARTSIEDQVRQVRETIAQEAPITSPNEAGIYAVAAAHPGGEVRVGSGFTIFSDASETFLVTSYALVATPDGFAVRTAEVYLPSDTVTASVHNYDRDLDIATLRLRGGPLPVPEWRPGEQEVRRGDLVYAAGIAGPGTPTVVEGTIAGVSAEAIVPGLSLNAFLAGGPLVDASGKVIAIASISYRPFGPVDGDLHYAVPIRSVCRRLVRCTRADLSAGELGDEGGSGTIRTTPPPEPPPSPSPTQEERRPSPSPTASPPPTAPATTPPP